MSIVWKYFRLEKEWATCECGKVYHHPKGNSTSGLRNHLHRCVKVDSTSLVPSKPKVVLDKYLEPSMRKDRKAAADAALLKMIICGQKSFNEANLPSFHEFCNILQHDYKPLERHTISKYIKRVHLREQQRLMEKITAEATSIATTVDTWTSGAQHKSVGAVTGHWLDDDWTPHHACIMVSYLHGSHTGELLAEELFTKANDRCQHKIISATTDSASNIKLAATSSTVPNHTRCAAHWLSLSVKELLEKEPDISALISKLRRIVGLFHHSTLELEKFLQLQQTYPPEELKGGIDNGSTEANPTNPDSNDDQTRRKEKPLHLIQDVSTRWNSTYLMIHRFLRLQKAVKSYLATGGKAEPISDKEWTIMQDLDQLLKPFYELTVELSGTQYPTISSILPLIQSLRVELEKNQRLQSISGLAKSLLANVITRWRDIEASELHLLCTALDPRWSGIFLTYGSSNIISPTLVDKTQRVLELEYCKEWECYQSQQPEAVSHEPPLKKPKSSLYDNLIQFTNRSHQALQELWDNEFQSYIRYRKPHVYSNPYQWWKEHQHLFPILARLAKKYLIIPATSVPAERLFSDAGNIITDQRSQLAEESAEAQVWLFENHTYIQDWDPYHD